MFILDFPHPECYSPTDTRFRELYLYFGNRCNRDCRFCTVFGGTQGWMEPFQKEQLDFALELIASDGHLKVYGGEPVLNLQNIDESLQYLRQGGFTGRITLFHNGVLFPRIQKLLERDPKINVALNYSIYHCRGADALKPEERISIDSYKAQHPDQVYLAHPDLIPNGRGAEEISTMDPDHNFQLLCPLCFPVLTSRGELKACPFFVETRSAYHFLGEVGDPVDLMVDRYKKFREWVECAIHSFVDMTGRYPCDYCVEFAAQAPFTYVQNTHNPWTE